MGETPKDHELFAKVEHLAAKRNSIFIPVKMSCSTVENIKRIQNLDRLTRLKSIDAQDVYNQHIIHIKHPNLLELDVSTLESTTIATRILEHAESCNEVSIEGNPVSLIQRPNFYLFTGGPGAGKTAVLNELKEQGNLVIAEVARDIIKHQQRIGGNATHTGNRMAYCDLMLKKSIADYTKMLPVTEKIVFFDRGIPDLYSYSGRFCGGVTAEIIEYVNNYRYNQTAFLFPPWPEIYCYDAERKQDINEAIETYHAVKEGCLKCGYEVIEIPKISITERAKYILKIIDERKS